MARHHPLSDLPIKTADVGLNRGFSVNVTVISKTITSMPVVWCIVWPSQAGTVQGNWTRVILANFAAWYIWVVATILVVAQTLGFGVEQFVAGVTRIGIGGLMQLDG